MVPRQQGEGTREGRHAKCRWCDCHLGLRDQAGERECERDCAHGTVGQEES